ncbi:hypothetical protein FGG08_000261 [Glutinoglossum americanum]|uniref:BZIP domain-containing protein n=1 Tax=Glutinoglossum americanum TaxID=1670608 RepID=A0A9P8IAJ0_9PEZI|nr:hypothetical protein FGG08_000261 [Glutinoglossum americanum]
MADEPFSPMFGFSSGGESPASIDLNEGKREDEERQKHQQQQDAATNFAPSSMWEASKQENHLDLHKSLMGHSQEPSPPHSSSHSPESWPYGNLQSATSLHQLLAKRSATETCSVHGQITPPTCGSPNPVLAGGAINYDTAILGAQISAARVKSQNLQGASKRKRNSDVSQTAEATESPKKERRRRSSTKSSLTPEAKSAGADEDAKRSRFLERNRLAASKCRQKKKEWTKGLEERARNLQNEKLQLQMMVGSLKSEMIYVREELLKHGNCGCKRIRDYLNTEVNALAQNQGQLSYLMRDIPSRNCSVTPSINGSHKDSIINLSSSVGSPLGSSHESGGPGGSQTRDSKADEDLHALLAAQLCSETDEDMLMER